MIDEKKIEEAPRQISEKVVDAKGFDDSNPTHLAFAEGNFAGFKAGAILVDGDGKVFIHDGFVTLMDTV